VRAGLVIFDFTALLRGESADRGVHPRRAAQQMIYYVATLCTVLAAAPKKDCCCSKRLRPATEHQHGMFAVVRQSLRRYYTAVIPRHSWLSDSAPVAAPAGNMLRRTRRSYTCSVLRRLTCSDVMI